MSCEARRSEALVYESAIEGRASSPATDGRSVTILVVLGGNVGGFVVVPRSEPRGGRRFRLDVMG